MTEEIVISGISCRLPESEDMSEFWENLVTGKDMITETDRRWPPGLHGLPRRMGTLKDISKFDAGFFGIPPKQAHLMDPQIRMLIECTHEAIIDSGHSPGEVKGSLTGCYMCSIQSDAHDLLSKNAADITGYEMTGCNRAMLSNRVSFTFDLKGPSVTLDTACSSGLEALCSAVSAIRDGRCDAAIVGASSLLLKPETSLQFHKLTMLSPDGACKSFDASGNGYVRSEGIVVLYLQKEEEARRAYTSIAAVVDNCDGFKEKGITFPSGEVQKQLLLRTYKAAGMDPTEVSFMEAHGTGTAAGDPQELNSIADVICPGRKGPLLIGSVKSNMGHGESVAGLAAIAKVILAMQHKLIPGNLHYSSPNTEIPALSDGRFQVVSKNTPWEGGTVGVNSFGFGGANVHAILRPYRQVASAQVEDSLRMVAVAGRDAAKVKAAIELAVKNPHSLSLHHMMAGFAGAGKQLPCRGYAVLNARKEASEVKECKEPGPLWYIFPGMGQQWHGMGRDMLKIPQFRAALVRSDQVLQQEGFGVLDLLQSDDPAVYDDPLNAAVGISSIQVALVELLRCMGLRPDGMIGHSVGELGCAFADGTLTAEQTVKTAYWRGKCIKAASLPPGGMAAVGMTWEEAKKRCPDGVVAACHNAEQSVTISGPKESVGKFVKELSDEGVFAREVNSSGVAFHSYFMKECAPQLTSALEKVIPSPKARSSRWISSSIPESEWQSPLAKMSSPAYHVNNFTSSVLFHEAVQHIPADAIVVEVGAQGLFQGVLKRALKPTNFITCLMKKGDENNRSFFYTNIGKCHLRGLEIHPENLYRPPKFPVPVETPMLSSLVGWNHDTSWKVPRPSGVAAVTDGGGGGGVDSAGGGGELVEVAMSQKNFIADHVLDGKILYPAMGYLNMVWDTYAKSRGVDKAHAPVVFTQCHIHSASVLQVDGTVTFSVSISSSTGRFEVSEKGELAVDGFIHALPAQADQGVTSRGNGYGDHDDLLLDSDDFYKELRVRGYEYGPHFCSVLAATSTGNQGKIQWRGNWVTYLDAMLQVCILQNTDRVLRLPTRIKRLEIMPGVLDANQEKVVHYEAEEYTGVVSAPGVVMRGAHFTSAPRRIPHRPPLLEKFIFTPYVENPTETEEEYRVYTEACIDAVKGRKIASADTDSTHLSSVSSLNTNLAGSNGPVRRGGKRSLPPLVDTPTESPTFTRAAILTKRGETKYALLDDILKVQAGDFDEEDDYTGATAKARDVHWKEDRLLDGHLHKQDLKTALDVYIENSANQRIKLLILCPSAALLYTYAAKVYKVTQLFPHAQVSITACTPDTAALDPERFHQLGVKIGEWFFGNGVPPEHISSAHVILACNFLTDRNRERTQEFRDLCHKVPPATHLLVHEWCQCPELYSFIQDMCVAGGTSPSLSKPYPTRTFIEDQGLDIVVEKNDGVLAALFSCRKPSFTPGIIEHVICTDPGFGWMEEIKRKYEKVKEDPNGRIWLISDGPAVHGLIGMVSCLLQEPIGAIIRCLFNADHEAERISHSYLPGGSAWTSLVHRDLVMNAIKGGQLGCFRRHFIDQKFTEKPAECALVESFSRGDLTSIHWVSVPAPPPPVRLQSEVVHVVYASMNFRDLMLASGRLSTDAIPKTVDVSTLALGLEFSGVNDFGERRMGLVPSGGMATEVSLPPQYLWPVPQGWSMADAASVPVAYVTAFYALLVRGQMQKGERVLIHSGTSTVGQAAIRIALARGCSVYTTTGTPEKVTFLQKEFSLARDRIYHSRSLSFVDDILKHTKGQGVDIVLNSLSEEKLQSSIDLLTTNGRFLEIGKFDLSNNSKMGMAIFLKNIAFHGILVENLMTKSSSDWIKVWKLVQEGISRGIVRPIDTHIFRSDQLEKAFRFMGDGKHIGKVLIKVRPDIAFAGPSVKSGRRQKIKRAPVRAIARTNLSSDKVYIITGGLGGLGLELANWLVQRGARYLALTSRSGVKTGYQRRLLQLWQKQGVEVLVSNRDVASPKETGQLFADVKKMAPVGGVFHLAAVLHDTHFANMTMEKWKPVTDIKVTGTMNLDRLTRSQCANSLDYFVTFSSAASGYGNAGQSNYGYGNSFMERLCERRTLDGFPGKAIQWGFIGDVGIVQDSLGGNKLYHLGMVPQRVESFLETIDLLLQMPDPVVSSVVPADRATMETTDGSGQAVAQDDVSNVIMNILGVEDVTEVDPAVPMSEFGLDSLMTTEIRQTLGRRFNLQLTVAEVQSLSLDGVKDMIKNG